MQTFRKPEPHRLEALSRLRLMQTMCPCCFRAGVPKHNFSYMGYSIRTDRWRYTEWAEWNGPSLEPVWMANPAAPGALVELYDHALDTGSGKDMWNLFENENVAHANGGAVRQLSARIRAFFAPR